MFTGKRKIRSLVKSKERIVILVSNNSTDLDDRLNTRVVEIFAGNRMNERVEINILLGEKTVE